ncbi:hypothetical protein ACT8ZR_02115 [Neobacillus sp. M.A.Huq-85]
MESSRIIRWEDDGCEMNITVDSAGLDVLDDKSTLIEIVDFALTKGFSRFVGTAGNFEDDPDYVFIFAKPNYFDNDDCLVRNPAASEKINRIIIEKNAKVRGEKK